jgi:hypothetical protein
VIRRRNLLVALGATLATGCLGSEDRGTPEGNRTEGGRSENSAGSHTDDEETKIKPGEKVVHNETRAASPYGDEIDPRNIVITSTIRRDVEVSVYDNAENKEVYSLNASLYGVHEGVRIGKPGEYEVSVSVNGDEYEEVWKVGKGFGGMSIEISEEEVEIRTVEKHGTLVLTRVSSSPPGVEPDSYENVSQMEPFAEAFERLDKCTQDDSRDYCVYPPEGAWEEMGDPRQHITATQRVSGSEYGTVLSYMVEDGKGSANMFRPEADELGYREGYYVERDGVYYSLMLSSGLSPSQPSGPLW